MRVRLEKDGVVAALNEQPLARGGEAAIFPILERADQLAKVYHQPTPELADKLAAMIAKPPADPTAKQGHTSIAWPTDRLLAENGGACVGFVMPRVDKAQSLFDVYNPKSRLQTWPLFHYGYLLRTARNLSIAVRALHARGYVLGDLNESNVLVNGQTLVTVVDTDSFQVRAGGRVFRCTVGKPEFIAPEIQGADLATVDRTPEHDHFALGVLIFQLLMQGSHPFAGRFTGEGEPGTLAQRIAAGHWPHARRRKGPFAPNPTAPAFAVLPTQLRELMRLCFEDGHDRPKMRPDAGRWQKALAEADAELIECVVNSQHRFHKDQHGCPWCEMAKRQGRDPFLSKEKVQARADGPGAPKPAPTAVAPAKSTPTTPTAPGPTSRRRPEVRKRGSVSPPSFLATPWPWIIGGVGLSLFLGLCTTIAALALWPSAPKPIVFGPPDTTPAPTKRSAAEKPGAAPGGFPAGMPDPAAGGFLPDGPAAPGAVPPGGPGGVPEGAGLPDGAPPAGPAGGPAVPAALRRMPDLLLPDESRAAVVRFQVPCFVLSKDGQFLMGLKGGLPGAPGMAPNLGPRGRPVLPTDPAFGPNAQKFNQHGLLVDRNGPKPDETDKDFETEWVRVDQIQDLAGVTPAEQMCPVRAAEIVATFPFKKQVEEFRDKLALRADEDVFQETSAGTRDGPPLASFRFLGVNVERRQVDQQGQPVGDKDGWAPLDLDAYRLLAVLGGKRFEEEVPDLKPVAFSGLVMPKLATFGARRNPPVDDYPNLEAELKNLTTTLEMLPKDGGAVARPAATRDPGSVFDLDPDLPADGPGPLPPGAGAPLFGPGGAPPGVRAALQAPVIPEHCLIRLFDVTIEPGKTYEYRLRVRMANPNYARKDADDKAHADDKELSPKDWYVLPEKVAVPPEVSCYAVDQRALDAKNPNRDPGSPRTPVPPLRVDQTVLQIHRWFDYVPTKNRLLELSVGDWVIAERVAATRGEPIGRQRAEVPYWRTMQARFLMASDAPAKTNTRPKAPATIEVPFFPDGEEPILVDFTGGELAYKRVHPQIDDAAADQPLPVQDRAAVEVLLCTADGKLLAHNAEADAADPARDVRLNAVRDWIEQVKNVTGGRDVDPFKPFGP